MSSVHLILPYPPAVNNLYFTMVLAPKWPQTKHRAIRVLSDEAKSFKAKVADIAEGLTPFVGDVRIDFKVFRPRRIGDLDGVFKVTIDSLTGYAFNDDKQVTEIHAVRLEDKYHPRLEVEISPLGLC